MMTIKAKASLVGFGGIFDAENGIGKGQPPTVKFEVL